MNSTYNEHTLLAEDKTVSTPTLESEISTESKESKLSTTDMLTAQLARKFKTKQSFARIKEASARDLGTDQAIDLLNQSKKNMRAIRTRLAVLSDNEIKLFDRITTQQFYIHHTTSNPIIQSIKSSSATLRDPAELARHEQSAQTIHTGEFCGIENNIFFGLGTAHSEIPMFTRFSKDPKTKEPVDYCTIRIDLLKLQKQAPDIVKSLWSSGHFFHFLKGTSIDHTSLPEFTIGETTVSWVYEVENPITESQKLIKKLIFTKQNKIIHSMRIGIDEEIAVGKDIIPYYALCFIERLRYLDSETSNYIFNHPNDNSALTKLMEVFFRVDEFEIHLPANLPLSDYYTTYITPGKRKEITEAVSLAAQAGNIQELEKLYSQHYPLSGYMFDDDYHYDKTLATTSPLIAAIKAKQYEAVDWLLSHGSYSGCFNNRSGSCLIVQSNETFTISYIAQIFSAAIATNDMKMIELIIDKHGLKINSYFDSKLFKKIKNLPEDTASLIKRISNLSSVNDEKEESKFNYDPIETDMIFIELLKLGLEQTTDIYRYLSQKFNYCLNEKFIIREMFDIAIFGNQAQMEYHKRNNSLFSHYSTQLEEIAKENGNHSVCLVFVLGNQDKMENALVALQHEMPCFIFNTHYADALLIQLGFIDKPEVLRSYLGEEWIQTFIWSGHHQKVPKPIIIARLQWLVNRLGVDVEEMFISTYASEFTNVIERYCYHNCLDEAKTLLESGAKAYYPELKTDLVHHALVKGNVSFAQYLLKERNVPFVPDKELIDKLIYKGTKETLSLALQLGAVISNEEYGPLITAISYRRYELADILHKNGALPWPREQINEIEKCNFIIWLADGPFINNFIDVIDWLIEHKILDISTIQVLYNHYADFNRKIKNEYSSDDEGHEVRRNIKKIDEDADRLKLVILFFKYLSHSQFSDEFLASIFIEHPLLALELCNNKIDLSSALKSIIPPESREEFTIKLLSRKFSEANFMTLATWINKHFIQFDIVFKNNQNALYDLIKKLIESSNDHYHVIKKLLSLVIDFDFSGKESLLYIACTTDQSFLYSVPVRNRTIELLLKSGANPHTMVQADTERLRHSPDQTVYEWVCQNKPELKSLFLPYVNSITDSFSELKNEDALEDSVLLNNPLEYEASLFESFIAMPDFSFALHGYFTPYDLIALHTTNSKIKNNVTLEIILTNILSQYGLLKWCLQSPSNSINQYIQTTYNHSESHECRLITSDLVNMIKNNNESKSETIDISTDITLKLANSTFVELVKMAFIAERKLDKLILTEQLSAITGVKTESYHPQHIRSKKVILLLQQLYVKRISIGTLLNIANSTAQKEYYNLALTLFNNETYLQRLTETDFLNHYLGNDKQKTAAWLKPIIDSAYQSETFSSKILTSAVVFKLAKTFGENNPYEIASEIFNCIALFDKLTQQQIVDIQSYIIDEIIKNGEQAIATLLNNLESSEVQLRVEPPEQKGCPPDYYNQCKAEIRRLLGKPDEFEDKMHGGLQNTLDASYQQIEKVLSCIRHILYSAPIGKLNDIDTNRLESLSVNLSTYQGNKNNTLRMIRNQAKQNAIISATYAYRYLVQLSTSLIANISSVLAEKPSGDNYDELNKAYIESYSQCKHLRDLFQWDYFFLVHDIKTDYDIYDRSIFDNLVVELDKKLHELQNNKNLSYKLKIEKEDLERQQRLAQWQQGSKRREEILIETQILLNFFEESSTLTISLATNNSSTPKDTTAHLLNQQDLTLPPEATSLSHEEPASLNSTALVTTPDRIQPSPPLILQGENINQNAAEMKNISEPNNPLHADTLPVNHEQQAALDQINNVINPAINTYQLDLSTMIQQMLPRAEGYHYNFNMNSLMANYNKENSEIRILANKNPRFKAVCEKFQLLSKLHSEVNNQSVPTKDRVINFYHSLHANLPVLQPYKDNATTKFVNSILVFLAGIAGLIAGSIVLGLGAFVGAYKSALYAYRGLFNTTKIDETHKWTTKNFTQRISQFNDKHLMLTSQQEVRRRLL